MALTACSGEPAIAWAQTLGAETFVPRAGQARNRSCQDYSVVVADHFLLQSQQNDVFTAIQESGLNPAEFDWVTMRTEATQIGAGGERIDVPVVMHHDAGAYFKFDVNLNRPTPQAVSFYTPGYDSTRDRRSSNTWADQLGYVRSWLDYLKREYHAPDL